MMRRTIFFFYVFPSHLSIPLLFLFFLLPSSCFLFNTFTYLFLLLGHPPGTFSLYFFFLFERERERKKESYAGSTVSAEPHLGLNPRLLDPDLSRNQESDAQPAETPKCPKEPFFYQTLLRNRKDRTRSHLTYNASLHFEQNLENSTFYISVLIYLK